MLLLILGPAGRTLVADVLDLPRLQIKVNRTRTPYLGLHHLTIGSIRLALELACADSGGAVTLTEWVSEPELRARPTVYVQDPRPRHAGQTPPQIPLVSDGEFTLTLADGSSQGFRLEVDLTGSTSPKRLRTKLCAYLAHVDHDGRRVLWAVPDDTRAVLLASWCLAEAKTLGADPSLFWITTRGLIDRTTILQSIWREPGGSLAALLPSALASSSQAAARSSATVAEGGSQWTL